MKKDFSRAAEGALNSADALINTIVQEPEQKPVLPASKKASAREQVCFMADADQMEKLRIIAFLNRKSIAKELRAAIDKYIADYEKRNGVIGTRL